jgi:hypothetical protein
METNNIEKEIATRIEPKKFGLKLFTFGLVLGLSLIAASVVVSYTILGIKNSDNIISVSGSAKEKVVADNARWVARFTRTSTKDQLKNSYELMKSDEIAVRDFMKSQGIDTYEISPVSMDEIYKNDQNSPKEYNLSQTIDVKSNEPSKMKAVAKNSETLVTSGVMFQPNAVEYYYSKLPELRISLLPQAIKDARARAGMIAETSGLSVASVKSVSMGVVQVLAEGSIDVSDYGSYDTSTIDKEVMVTVKTVFGLR